MELRITLHVIPRVDLWLYNTTELFFFPSFHFSKPRVRGLLPLSAGCVMTTDTFLPWVGPAPPSPTSSLSRRSEDIVFWEGPEKSAGPDWAWPGPWTAQQSSATAGRAGTVP